MVTIRVTAMDGGTPEHEASECLGALLSRLRNAGDEIGKALVNTVRGHLVARFPGSEHWDPNKVEQGQSRNGPNPSGEAVVKIPGASRAFHDVTIRPRFRRALAIPFPVAKGKKPSDYPDAFQVRTRDGRGFLAQKQGSQLVFLFTLASRAFQRQDRSIMPSDDTMMRAVAGRIKRILES